MKTRRYRSAYKAGKAAGYAEGYMKGLHDGNPFTAIAEAASNIVKKITDPEFVEACKEAKNMYDEERRRELDEEDRYADYLDREAELRSCSDCIHQTANGCSSWDCEHERRSCANCIHSKRWKSNLQWYYCGNEEGEKYMCDVLEYDEACKDWEGEEE